jgi:uncharacterized protein GlcG (DUF336 family)
MSDTTPTLRLTLAGAQRILEAARRKAEDIGVPECIVVVDAGGHMLAMCRMDGAFVFSIDTALRKAQTAAIYREPTGNIAEGIDLRLAVATEGKRINLPGGLPIIVEGQCVGGIGVGSGTGAEDREVGNAGLAALAGAKRF